MKNLLKHYAACAMALALLALLPVACTQEDTVPGDSATVTMKFTTRAGRAADGNALLDNEQMQTLRVVVARAATREIVYNLKYDIEPDETSKTITFSELTVNKKGEAFDFYAIANEAALAADVQDLGSLTPQGLEDLYNHILATDFNTGATPALLPQAAHKQIQVGPDANKEETMQLNFPLGKIRVSFVNQTGEETTVSDVQMAGVAPDQAYLFSQGKRPDGTTLEGDIDFGDVAVPAGTEAVPATATAPVRYIYPGSKGAGLYKLTATWNGQPRELVLASGGAPLASILRNQLLDITITLKQSGGFTVTCSVAEWKLEEYEYDLSDSGTFVVDGVNAKDFSWNDGNGERKAIATQYGTESGADDRYATFTIKLDAPRGVRWTAHLDNTSEFEFVGNAAPGGVGGDGQVVTIKIRPTAGYAQGTRKRTNLSVMLHTAPGEQQKFVDPGDFNSENGTTIPIVQVSPAEGDIVWSQTVQP